MNIFFLSNEYETLVEEKRCEQHDKLGWFFRGVSELFDKEMQRASYIGETLRRIEELQFHPRIIF